jgi:hypothetical protein
VKLIPTDAFKKVVEGYDAKSSPELVIVRIDEAVQKGIVEVGKPGQGTTEVGADWSKSGAAEVEIAIGTIQAVFGKAGISIAMLGEDHGYKEDAPRPPNVPAELQGIEDSLDELRVTDPGFFRQIGRRVAEFQHAQRTYQADSAHYEKSLLDMRRAQTITTLADGGEQIPKPDLTIVERAMQYDPQSNPVRETDIIKHGFTIKQRSALIAAYIFLSVAGGDQSGDDRVLILFGAQHADIFDYFDEFARKSKSIPWIKMRKRNYAVIKSHTQ